MNEVTSDKALQEEGQAGASGPERHNKRRGRRARDAPEVRRGRRREGRGSSPQRCPAATTGKAGPGGAKGGGPVRRLKGEWGG